MVIQYMAYFTTPTPICGRAKYSYTLNLFSCKGDTNRLDPGPLALGWPHPRPKRWVLSGVRWPWGGPIHARSGGYYPGLDAYAGIWMLPARPLLVQLHLAPSLYQRSLDCGVSIL